MAAARKALGLTRPAFVEKFGGFSVRTIENNESGRNEPGALLIGVLATNGINANWLLTGDGPMRVADLKPPPMKINRGALAAVLSGAIAITARGMSADKAAELAAEMYESALESGEITPDGIGEGNLGKAA